MNAIVLTSYSSSSSVDGDNGLFLPSVFEICQRHSFRLFGLTFTILVQVHYRLSGHTCLQGPLNAQHYPHLRKSMEMCNMCNYNFRFLLVKLLKCFTWLSKLSESFLVDQIGFARVALILIFFRQSNIKGCLRYSYSLGLHVTITVQGLRAILHLVKKQQHTNTANVRVQPIHITKYIMTK